MKTIRVLIAAALIGAALTNCVRAASQAVTVNPTSGDLNGTGVLSIGLNVPAGQTLTVKAGATLNASGATVVLPGTVTTLYTTLSVTSISALRAFSTTSVVGGQYIIVSGYYAANDGGGGVYVWNATSTATDNGGTIIQPTGVATGRWFLQYTTSLTAKQFGAKCDGSTDDGASVSALWSYLASVGGGTMVLNNNLTIISPITLTVPNAPNPFVVDLDGGIVNLKNVSGTALTFTSTVGYRLSPLIIQHGMFKGTGTTPAGVKWSNVLGSKIDNVTFSSIVNALVWNFVEDSKMSAVQFLDVGTGLYLTNSTNQNEFASVWFNGVSTLAVLIDQSSSLNSFHDCLFQSCTGTYTIKIDSTGSTYAISQDTITRSWFELCGDGTTNARCIYITAGAQACVFHAITYNFFNPTVTGGQAIGFGSGDTHGVYIMGNNFTDAQSAPTSPAVWMNGSNWILYGGSLQALGTGDASSPTTGELTTAGGLGVAKKAYIGSDLYAQGNQFFGTTSAGVVTQVGIGGTGAWEARLLLNGSGTVGQGSRILMQNNGVNYGQIGNAGLVTGSNDQDLAIEAIGNLRLLSGGNNQAVVFDSVTQAATFTSTVATTLNHTWDLGAANTVSPTSPNRTITVKIDGVTYYIAAKTTND